MKTLTDFNRSAINLQESKVSEVLPEHYLSEYPTLITFLDKYYSFMDSDSTYNFAAAIHEMYGIRDTEDAKIGYIDNILKELGQGLLNQNFFLEPRFAMRLVAQFYRVKGSLYSSEGFFRAFYQSEVEITYPKRDIFIVGESQIGYESQKVIQDGALYQIYSHLVKSEVPVATWRELYKAFVHPSGFYLGAQTLIVSAADLDVDAMPISIADSAPVFYTGLALNAPTAAEEITKIIRIADSSVRSPVIENISTYQDMTITELEGYYGTIAGALDDTSNTFDEDSAAGQPNMDFANTVETADKNKNELWDSDSDGYLLQIS